jgi:hypothetical protein
MESYPPASAWRRSLAGVAAGRANISTTTTPKAPVSARSSTALRVRTRECAYTSLAMPDSIGARLPDAGGSIADQFPPEFFRFSIDGALHMLEHMSDNNVIAWT